MQRISAYTFLAAIVGLDAYSNKVSRHRYCGLGAFKQRYLPCITCSSVECRSRNSAHKGAVTMSC